MGRLAQLVRAAGLQPAGRGFESLSAHHPGGEGKGAPRKRDETPHAGSGPGPPGAGARGGGGRITRYAFHFSRHQVTYFAQRCNPAPTKPHDTAHHVVALDHPGHGLKRHTPITKTMNVPTTFFQVAMLAAMKGPIERAPQALAVRLGVHVVAPVPHARNI